MRQSFDEVLRESLRRLENGESLESVLGSHPGYADELRRHLRVWSGLSAAEKPSASGAGKTAGLDRLLSALAPSQRPQRVSASSLATKGGLTMRYAAALVVGAALALGVVFLADGLHFGGGDSAAEADIPHPCLTTLDLNGDGNLTVEDVLLFKGAIESQDLTYDFNGDTVVDIHDGIKLIQDVVECLGNIQIPPPNP